MINISLETARFIKDMRNEELREIEAAEKRVTEAKRILGRQSLNKHINDDRARYFTSCKLLALSLFLLIGGTICLVLLLISFPSTITKMESNDRLSVVIINNTKEQITQPVIYQTINNITEIKERTIERIEMPQVTRETLDYADNIIHKYND